MAPKKQGRPLDRRLFWLRWPLLAGLTLLGPLGGDALGMASPYRTPEVLIVAGAGVGINLLLGVLALTGGGPPRLLTALNALADSALAGGFYWVYGGAAAPLLVSGTMATLPAAFRCGLPGALLALILVTLASLPGLLRDPVTADALANWALSLVLLGALSVLGWALRASLREMSWAERVEEAQHLRAARERARAIYEMANALSASLDHRRVLEAAQAIGALVLRDELGPEVRLISAVLLFQGEDHLLRVITAQGLTRADTMVAVPGKQGVLGLALNSVAPVFGGDGNRDPELSYFVAFQEARSVLAIPLRAGIDVYGVMVFGADYPNAFSDDHIELMTAIGTQSALALQNAVLYQNLLLEKERIVEVEEDARKKLARDLHDGPTQSVAAIAMRINYIRRLVERQPQQALEELWKIEDLARRTTREIRHMLFTLRPLVLESQGLLAALEQLAQKMRDTYDTTVIVEGSPEVERLLDSNAQGVLFYIAEEAVNNARKHAQSSHIWVRLLTQNGAVAVEIEDDGVGFDVQEVVGSGYEQRGSLGMVNMRERAELIQGTLHIDSAPGKGTRIRILVPLRLATDSGEEQAAAPPLELQSQRAAQRTPGRGIKPLPAQRKGTPKPVTGPLKPLPARTRGGKAGPLSPPPGPDTEKGP